MRALLAAALFTVGAHAQPLASAPVDPLSRKIDAAVRAVHEAGAFDGVVLVVEGTPAAPRVLYEGAFGLADRTWRIPMTPDVRFPLASITKQVAAVVAHRLEMDGRLDLGAPVARYVPGLIAGGDSVLVRYLLNHTSGLPDLDADGGAAWRCPLPGEPDTLAIAADVIRLFGSGPLRATPGGTVAYNNADYLVLEAVMEAATGEPFEALLRHEILDPLGMTDSGLLRPSGTVERLATAYAADEPSLCLARWRYGGAAALYGTAADLARFDLALISGDLLPPDRLDALWASSSEMGFVAQGAWSYTKPIGDARVRVIERQGTFGALGVLNVLLPDQGRAVILLKNPGDANLFALSHQPGLPDDLVRLVAAPPEAE
ncbi:serine hydrolase domain-containing protein [Rubrivirga marina]|uniref:Beta-lactamase-related domain-containing protein n=1 Tax=Rubrivirga marina TaxID=1196024 RepID=A0A271IZU2_9BACT|nr:serine hydrolase domain-containing protein [Rubrivirga marina]PAP76597.1 hypothetical protein BSZ37_09165 [Rubrivirga marina]